MFFPGLVSPRKKRGIQKNPFSSLIFYRSKLRNYKIQVYLLQMFNLETPFEKKKLKTLDGWLVFL